MKFFIKFHEIIDAEYFKELENCSPVKIENF